MSNPVESRCYSVAKNSIQQIFKHFNGISSEILNG